MSVFDNPSSIFSIREPPSHRDREARSADDPLTAAARATLLAFARRRRALAITRAALLATAAGVLMMLAVCVLDRLLPLPGLLRLVLLIANVMVIAFLLSRPLRELLLPRRESLIREARRLERLVPELREQLITLSSNGDLARSGEPLVQRGGVSPAIVRELGVEVDRLLARTNVAALLPWRLLNASVAPAAAVVGLALALACWPWLDLAALIGRYALPLSPRPPVTSTRLFIEPGNTSVIAGQPVQIHVQAVRLGEGAVTLHIEGMSSAGKFSAGNEPRAGDEMTATMTPLPPDPGAFGYAFPSVDHDFTYFVTGGDARSPRYLVRALRTPGVLELRGIVRPPPYVREAPAAFSSADGRIEALRGSTIDLTVVASEPLRSAQIILSDERIEMRPVEGALAQPNVRHATLQVQRDAALRIEMTSVDGIAGAGPAGARIRAVSDQAPTVRWDVPASTDLHLGPRDRLNVPYAAADDVGLSSLSVNVQVNGSPAVVLPLPLSQDARGSAATLRLAMSMLDVGMGDLIELTLLAADGAGQICSSAPLRVYVSPAANDLETRGRIAALEEAIAATERMAGLCERGRALFDEPVPAQDMNDSPDARRDAAAPYAAAAADSASRAIEAMLRTIARTDPPSTVVALSRMADTIQQQQSRLQAFGDHLVEAAGANSDLDRDRLAVETARNAAREIAAGLRVLWQGERAEQALAELENAQAWDVPSVSSSETSAATTQPPAPAALPMTPLNPHWEQPELRPASRSASQSTMRRASQPSAQASVRRMIFQLRRDARAAGTELGIELPTTGPITLRLNQGLRQRVEQVRAFATSQAPVDFAGASRAWAENTEARQGWAARLILASRAEAVSMRGDAVRARDLQLAARAAQRIDEALATVQPNVRSAYAEAMAALQEEHELNQALARDPRDPRDARDARTSRPASQTRSVRDAQAERVRSAAAEARHQMRRWSGDQVAALASASSQPSAASELSAMEANAAAAVGEYDLAAALDAKPRSPTGAAKSSPASQESPQGADANRDEGTANSTAVTQTVRARAINQLEQRQRQLRSRTTRANLAPRPALSDMQAALADDIDRQVRQAQSTGARAALGQLREARQRLGAIERDAMNPAAATNPTLPAPSSLPTTKQAAINAASTDPSDTAPYGAGDAAGALARELRKSVPEALSAARIIERQIVPALSAATAPPTTTAANRNTSPSASTPGTPSAAGTGSGGGGSGGGGSGGAGGASGAASEARVKQAFLQARRAMAQAEQALLAAEPIAGAALAARDAASAMEQHDATAAHSAQDKTAELLAAARRQALADAARARLEEIPTFSSLFRPTAGASNSAAGVPGHAPGSGSAPGTIAREWGRLRERSDRDMTAPVPQIDPPGFQDALRAYFQALNKSANGPRRVERDHR